MTGLLRLTFVSTKNPEPTNRLRVAMRISYTQLNPTFAKHCDCEISLCEVVTITCCVRVSVHHCVTVRGLPQEQIDGTKPLRLEFLQLPKSPLNPKTGCAGAPDQTGFFNVTRAGEMTYRSCFRPSSSCYCHFRQRQARVKTRTLP